MTVLLDINILLDFLQRRPGFMKPAAELFAAIETRRAVGYVAGHTITTVHYIMRRSDGAVAAASAVSHLLQVLEVVPVERQDFIRALGMGGETSKTRFRPCVPTRPARTQSSRAIQRIFRALRSRCALRLRCWRSFDHAAAMG